MRCEIDLSWRNGDEEMKLERSKNPDEVWADPRTGSAWRNVQQMIDCMDATYADARAALIALLPKETQDGVGIMVRMTTEQAKRLVGE